MVGHGWLWLVLGGCCYWWLVANWLSFDCSWSWLVVIGCHLIPVDCRLLWLVAICCGCGCLTFVALVCCCG